MCYLEVEITCTHSTHDSTETTRCIPCLVDLIACPAQVTTITYGYDGRPLVCPLFVYGSSMESTADEAHLMNYAVEVAVARSTPRPSYWYGPALILKCENLAMNSFIDIEDDDFAHVQAFFAFR